MRVVAALLLGTVAACDRTASDHARIAANAEAAAIVSAVVAQTVKTDPNSCFNRDFRPALEDQREMWATFKPNDVITEDDAKSWFVPTFPPEPRPVATSLGGELERQLRLATHLQIGTAKLRGIDVFPAERLAPTGPSELPCGRPGMTEYTLSEPIIVGQTAFVENGGVCGGLCGGGSVEAYRRTGDVWRLIARKPTWDS